MKKSSYNNTILLIFNILVISIFLSSCTKTENPIKFPRGTFPDSIVINMEDLNSPNDDYNISIHQLFASSSSYLYTSSASQLYGSSPYQLYGSSPIVFSSNRRSSGGQFDLEQGIFSFVFDQTNGSFGIGAKMTDDGFLDKLIKKAQTTGNDFGPYRLYSSVDGYEYMVLSSANGTGNLDLFYLKNRPVSGSSLPDVLGPYPVKLLNTNYDDAYLSFDANMDSAYFVTNKDGNFDIFLQKRPVDKEIGAWFDLSYTASTRVDSINSSYEDKCPLVYKKVMVFASNRPGGLGGFDLYYSIFRKGKWSSPVNLGPRINTSSDEYRPVIGYHPDFDNLFMMFSSNRTGGKGGFDLYFTGIKFPD